MSNPATEPGVAVPRVKSTEEKETIKESFQPYVVQGSEYLESPSLSNQWSEYPETCHVGPVCIEVIDLLAESGVESMNKIYSLETPENSPSLIIIEESEFKSDNHWKIKVKYRKVLYKKLIIEKD